MSSQQGDALDLASALCSQLRSSAADSITAAVLHLTGDHIGETAIDAAIQWLAVAELWEDAFALLALQFGTPGDLPWLARMGDASELMRLLQSTAAAARAGAGSIRQVRETLFDAIDTAARPAGRQPIPEAG